MIIYGIFAAFGWQAFADWNLSWAIFVAPDLGLSGFFDGVEAQAVTPNFYVPPVPYPSCWGAVTAFSFSWWGERERSSWSERGATNEEVRRVKKEIIRCVRGAHHLLFEGRIHLKDRLFHDKPAQWASWGVQWEANCKGRACRSLLRNQRISKLGHALELQF